MLNESDGAAESLDALTGFVEDLGTFLRSADGLALVDDMARAVAGLAADAINAALGLKLLATDIENAFAKMDPTSGRAGALANLTNPLFLLTEGSAGIDAEVERLINGEAFTEATLRLVHAKSLSGHLHRRAAEAEIETDRRARRGALQPTKV